MCIKKFACAQKYAHATHTHTHTHIHTHTHTHKHIHTHKHTHTHTHTHKERLCLYHLQRLWVLNSHTVTVQKTGYTLSDIFVYFEFTHQESHLRNEPVSHCVYFEYPQPHHVRLEGFTKQCLRIPLCDTLHRIRCWVRTPILFMVY